jgi:hypothetical protein
MPPVPPRVNSLGRRAGAPFRYLTAPDAGPIVARESRIRAARLTEVTWPGSSKRKRV